MSDRGVAAGSGVSSHRVIGGLLHWTTGRALAAGATKDEITDVLMAIIPVAGIGRVVSAAPEVATALGYDVESALEEPYDC
jgi:alkylhydroperoxidase/carboxymuconolactone decarboxylase family protein YurZ